MPPVKKEDMRSVICVKGCLAHPCMEVCPKALISMVNGKSYIDQKNVLSVENVNLSVHMMQFLKRGASMCESVWSWRDRDRLHGTGNN